MKKFFGAFLEWIVNEPFRSLNRSASHRATVTHLFTDVRKLKDVEVSGDTIAWIERG